jgi:hypothetical protein
MTAGGVAYAAGSRSSWSEKERLRGTIDKLTTENAGLKQQIAIAERENKFNEDRWKHAQQETGETAEQLKALEARLEKLEAQKAAGAPQADIDKTTLEIRSSLTKALVANTGTATILSSGPVRLFFAVPHHGVPVDETYSPENKKEDTP